MLPALPETHPVVVGVIIRQAAKVNNCKKLIYSKASQRDALFLDSRPTGGFLGL